MPWTSSAPYDGLRPQTPQYEAGLVLDPPVCEPSASRDIPSATAAAEPLEEPPGVCERSQGLRVGGGSTQANVVVTVLPRMIAPAARIRLTMGASSSATRPFHGANPASVGRPATSMMSFTPI